MLILRLLITLLVRLELSEAQIFAITCQLPSEDQQWELILWLRRMMGKDMDQKIEFGEIWRQAEKIEEDSQKSLNKKDGASNIE